MEQNKQICQVKLLENILELVSVISKCQSVELYRPEDVTNKPIYWQVTVSPRNSYKGTKFLVAMTQFFTFMERITVVGLSVISWSIFEPYLFLLSWNGLQWSVCQ